MLVLKYFFAVGTVLTAGLFALNAYLEPSESSVAARVRHSVTTASLFVVPPKQATAIAPVPVVAPLPAVARPPASSTHSANHRHRAR